MFSESPPASFLWSKIVGVNGINLLQLNIWSGWIAEYWRLLPFFLGWIQVAVFISSIYRQWPGFGTSPRSLPRCWRSLSLWMPLPEGNHLPMPTPSVGHLDQFTNVDCWLITLPWLKSAHVLFCWLTTPPWLMYAPCLFKPIKVYIYIYVTFLVCVCVCVLGSTCFCF